MNELIYIDDKFPSYQIIEKLSQTDLSRVFLAERNEKLYVIKEQPKEFCFIENPAILCELDFHGLPKIIDFYETDTSYFYSYEYINGVTLTEAYESGLITTSAAVMITEKLCKIVSYLHKKTLLHCDIKPNNIIINGDSVFLIDFGIAHIYNKKGSNDTVLIGTEGFVTPELGYRKTDYRADVYAIGMVLFYLLTGSTDIKELSAKVSDRALRTIINRSANYEVSKRYKTVVKLQNEIQKYKKGTAYRPFFAAGIAAVFVLCFVVGGIVYPEISESVSTFFGMNKPQVYEFSDPLIEQAIRISLGKTSDEPIYTNELLSVEGIYIAGERAFEKSEEIESYVFSLYGKEDPPLYASFSSVDDIKACRNLKTLSIQFNVIDNIDFLSENKFLRQLRLTNTNVADISVLKNLPHLTHLALDNCPINDLSPIKDCPLIDNILLYHINAVNYDFAAPDRIYSDISISFVNYDKFMQYMSGITVKRLSVTHCDISSFEVFPDMTVTETLYIGNNNLKNSDSSKRTPSELILTDGAKIVW
jgi:serine/threonine protein kinase